jgi:diguanylate cyclase (GGDEF)-like protein
VDVEVSASLISVSGREVLCILVRDITDRKRAEAVLRELAMRDGLTGLYNRREMQRMLKEEAERYIRYEQPTALIMVDIDHFKSVNDTYGHQVGDEVLRWVAYLMREMVRSVDKVARYGGEELAVILPEARAVDAYDVAERLRNAIASHPFAFTLDDEREETVLIPITISAGVACLPDDADSEDTLIEAADQALYEAKAQGRNRTVRCGKLQPRATLIP